VVKRNPRIEDGPGREVGAQRQRQRGQAELQRESVVENRNDLIVHTEVFEANGAALVMLEQIPGTMQVLWEATRPMTRQIS
jgi:hypothetical protein